MSESSEPGRGCSTVDTLRPSFLATDLANQDAATTAGEAPNRGGLFKLPVEVRLEIYRLCLPTDTVFDVRERATFRGAHSYSATAAALLGRTSQEVDGPYVDESEDEWDCYGDEEDDVSLDDPTDEEHQLTAIRALLLASRRIREEVLDVLYGENTFRIIVGPRFDAEDFKSKFPKEKRGRIRRLELIYKQFGTFAGDVPECWMPTFIWQDIIPNVMKLTVVFEQPTGDLIQHGRGCKRSVEDQMKLWCAELPPLLNDLGGLLPATAKIHVDVNRKNVTARLFMKHLGRPFKYWRTRTGYRLFRTVRGEKDWRDRWFG
ncbi:hypothetical protein GE09DRAFT_1260136 [Coniochaeta sp. 2T2.1]|nr:hypothetical protein GE09DRAFT_1260136 [Coniochaeta sp. 2T2.1]